MVWKLAAGSKSTTDTSKLQQNIVKLQLLLEDYVQLFNEFDEELYPKHIDNSLAFDFLQLNIPLFECPDKIIEQTYYFRWWTFRKHIAFVESENNQKESGTLYSISSKSSSNHSFFVISEFLTPVSWSQKYNTIPCAAAHHIREGRWLRNPIYVLDYISYWLREGNPRQYSFWIADTFREILLVHPTEAQLLLPQLYPLLTANFVSLQKTNLEQKRSNQMGLYFNTDNRDGMEMSIGGLSGTRGYRPTLNSYQYGEAMALSKLSTLLGYHNKSTWFHNYANRLKSRILSKLWDEMDRFFKVLPYRLNSNLVKVRELHGYTPWYFNIPDVDKLDAWKWVMDEKGFFAPYGLTTAEQSDPHFTISYNDSHECLWNGPVWPYASSITLTAMANTLQNLLSTPNHHPPNVSAIIRQSQLNTTNYFKILRIFASSHQRVVSSPLESPHFISLASRLKLEFPLRIPWIDENLDPFTGEWIARIRLKTWLNGTWDIRKGGKERGKDYNHSTFIDLIITGLLGIRPDQGCTFLINPLIPIDGENKCIWKYFCVIDVWYHSKWLSIFWDEDGSRYGVGKGYHIYVDNILYFTSQTIQSVKVSLESTDSI